MSVLHIGLLLWVLWATCILVALVLMVANLMQAKPILITLIVGSILLACISGVTFAWRLIFQP